MSVPADPNSQSGRKSEPTGSRGDAEDIVNQASQEIRERDRQRAERKPVDASRRGQTAPLIGLIVAIPVLIVVLMPNFTDWSWRSLFEPRLPPLVAREEAQKTLHSLVLEVESFRADYHQLPESLAEIGLPQRGRWNYSLKEGGRYAVTGNLYGETVSFESPAPAPNR